MKIKLICIGKNASSFIQEGVDEYSKRITKYISFEIVYIKALKISKSYDIAVLKKQECETVLKQLDKNDRVVLLDEKGKNFSSVEFSVLLERKISTGIKSLVFIIGGAYGFSSELYQRSDDIIALSKLTFPHQLVRIIFLEQLYRAFTILHKEPYHNE